MKTTSHLTSRNELVAPQSEALTMARERLPCLAKNTSCDNGGSEHVQHSKMIKETQFGMYSTSTENGFQVAKTLVPSI